MKKTLTLLAGALGVALPEMMAEPVRPNVIILMADDLGYGDLGCYGGTGVATPAVDSVAAHGLRLTRCHAPAATSTPSRYGILTGEYPWRREGTGVAAGNAAAIITPDRYTMAGMMRDAGYATAAIGKWHLGLGSTTGGQDWNGTLDCTPRHIGFDYHYIQAATADRVPCVYLEQDTVAHRDPAAPIEVSYRANFEGEPTGAANPERLKLMYTHGHDMSIVDSISRIGYMRGGGRALWRDENIADSIVAHSRRFILEHSHEPFFMYLCTNDVHVPRWPHPRFRGHSGMGLRGDAIASFDWTVAQVLAALDEAGVRDNTLLIITSDNGPVLDDGYADRAVELVGDHRPTGGHRGDKYSLYEGGTLVPAIVSGPGVQCGQSGALLSLIDLYASLAQLVGADMPAGAAPDSRAMPARFMGTDASDAPWVASQSTYNTVTVMTPQFKYVPATQRTGRLGWDALGHDGSRIDTGERTAEQLYDLLADPGETTDLAPDRPQLLPPLRRLYEQVQAPQSPPSNSPRKGGRTQAYGRNQFAMRVCHNVDIPGL